MVKIPTVRHTKKQNRAIPKINYWFLGRNIDIIGYAHLLTIFKDKKGSKSIMIKYLTITVRTSYNALIGRPSLNELGVIISTPHLTMKFPSKNGRIIVVWADQITTRECYATSLRVDKEKKGIKPKA